MADHPSVDEVSDSLEELIEEHLKRINEKLSKAHSLTDITDEVSQLNDFLTSYKQRTEMLDRLVDETTPGLQKTQIIDALKVQRVRVQFSRIELQRLIAKSHEIIARSANLVSRIQRRIDQETHKHSGYLLEECRLCRGVGGTPAHPCTACNGKGTLLVHQPATECPGCKGSGKSGSSELFHAVDGLCQVCGGFGWVLTIDLREADQ